MPKARKVNAAGRMPASPDSDGITASPRDDAMRHEETSQEEICQPGSGKERSFRLPNALGNRGLSKKWAACREIQSQGRYRSAPKANQQPQRGVADLPLQFRVS